MLHINDYDYDDMWDYNNNNNRQAPVTPTQGVGCPPMGPGCPNAPIVETPQERIVNRCFVHEVPHVCPINTRVINNHVFRHTYRPAFTCCEQNVISHVNEGCCGMFQ